GLITALAVSPGGQLAVAVDGHGVTIDGAAQPAIAQLACITAMAFEGEDVLWLAIGSTDNTITAWARDLLEHRASGRVLRCDLKSATVKPVAERLAYPNGIVWTPEGMIVSEAWTKRLVRLSPSGGLTGLMDDLPGYPAGVSRSRTDGFWLALFAPRSPLIELVLREPAYRKAMMREVDPMYWIAPALRSGQSFFEPMQGGALKQMGILKPWAPTRSYGLIVELSGDFTPVRSFHSRTGGRRHGVTSVAETDGEVWVASKGGDEIVRIDLSKEATA
ncbi:strictosidine synthase, partial [Salmonella enterica subsp. enterica]|nr:strictosidine synthase [Salmonella enterica subsp. enterica serovar Paratyphi A]